MPAPDVLGAPTNRTLAVALLDLLDAAREASLRGRALRAVGLPEAELRVGRGWLEAEALRAMFRAASLEPEAARRVGRALENSGRSVWALRRRGVASPAKAYRRCDQILARESRAGRYVLLELAGERARIAFDAGGEELEPLFCRVREGLLESLPLLFGRPQARVRESLCAARGDAARCEFEVHFAAQPRTGLFTGAIAGALLGGALGIGFGIGFPWLSLAIVVAAILAGGAGHAFDLARQLSALARSRAGVPEALEAAESALEEKMDELAKLETRSGGATPTSSSTGRAGRARVRLRPALERALASLRGDLPSDLEVECDEGARDVAVPCDAFQIEQLLIQLLRNAVAAACSVGRPGHVRISLIARADGAEIRIRDNGPGIDPDQMDRVFDPFLDGPDAEQEGGLGLAVSSRIVEAHGGELRFEDASGDGSEPGTCVTVFLPTH